MSALRPDAAAEAALRDARTRLGGSLRVLRGRLSPPALRAEAAAAARDAVAAGRERVREGLRRHPLAPVAAVFAIGLLLGLASRRR